LVLTIILVTFFRTKSWPLLIPLAGVVLLAGGAVIN